MDVVTWLQSSQKEVSTVEISLTLVNVYFSPLDTISPLNYYVWTFLVVLPCEPSIISKLHHNIFHRYTNAQQKKSNGPTCVFGVAERQAVFGSIRGNWGGNIHLATEKKLKLAVEIAIVE
jgi:hypothetical protein